MKINWQKIREDNFPALKDKTYLMAASASPLNRWAYEKSKTYLDEMLQMGDLNNEDYFSEVEEARRIIAEYIGSRPEEIAFTINTSSGMNMAAYMLRENKGKILYPSMEFPTSIHIFKRLGYPCIKVDDIQGACPISHFKKALQPDTKYLIHSQVQSFNGFRQNLTNLGKFCRENSLISIINATQAFGAFDIDVQRDNIDILVSNGLKWLGAGFGAGILYIKQELVEKYGLPITSWLSVEEPFEMDNENVEPIKHTSSMDSFGGCPNFPALLSLKGCFDFIKEKIGKGDIRKGVDAIQTRIKALMSILLEKLELLDLNIITPTEKDTMSGILTFQHEKAEKMHQNLVENKIYTTLKKYPYAENNTLIRIALNYYNNRQDIEMIVKFLQKSM